MHILVHHDFETSGIMPIMFSVRAAFPVLLKPCLSPYPGPDAAEPP